MSAKALLIVPPFIKYNAGPLLGPALLQAAAQRCGHVCSTMDLNSLWIRRYEKVLDCSIDSTSVKTPSKPLFQGDHNKSSILQGAEQRWNSDILTCANATSIQDHSLLRRLKYGFLEHDEVETVASSLANGSFGKWAQEQLLCNHLNHVQGERQMESHPFDLVGVSLLHAGQVIPAVALSILVRQLWPKAVVAWGGPHINGLGQALKEDLNRRTEFAADVFVQGHAEETWVSLLDQVVAERALKTPSCFIQPSVVKGRRGKFLNTPLVPSFDAFDTYDQPMTLPVQSSLGCAFGKCAFCTYPAMEGTPVQLSLHDTVEPVVQQALALGDKKCSGISFKDSLVTTKRLRDIAECVQRRVPWSACTKLSARLTDAKTLGYLCGKGLATLEIGLESIIPATQRRIGKIQSQALFEEFISQVAHTSNLSVVVNYITDFPWEDAEESRAALETVKGVVLQHLGGDKIRGKVEHNTFELERLSPMAQNPSKYGLQPVNLKSWPWASIIEQR